MHIHSAKGYPNPGGGILVGEQITPDAIGKEVGVRADLRRGQPKPREIQSQDAQSQNASHPGQNKNVKWQMSEKVRDRD